MLAKPRSFGTAMCSAWSTMGCCTMSTEQRPPSVFPAYDPSGYEQLMGRWTRRLAPLLIEFGGLADGEHVLDVGCGTGSVSYALPDAADVASVTGIDQSEVYLDYARQR